MVVAPMSSVGTRTGASPSVAGAAAAALAPATSTAQPRGQLAPVDTHKTLEDFNEQERTLYEVPLRSASLHRLI